MSFYDNFHVAPEAIYIIFDFEHGVSLCDLLTTSLGIARWHIGQLARWPRLYLLAVGHIYNLHLIKLV